MSVLLVFSGLWVPLGSDLIDSIKFYIKESPEERSRRIGCLYFTKSLYVEEMYENAMYVVEKGYDCKVPFCREYCSQLSDKACSPDYKRRVTERMSDRLEYMGKLNHVLKYNCDCSEAVRDACSYKAWLKDDYTDHDY